MNTEWLPSWAEWQAMAPPVFWGGALLAVVLARLLRPRVPRLWRASWQALALILVLLLAAMAARMLRVDAVAAPLREIAVLGLGMLVIRQAGMVVFRLMVPRLGVHPPRILEELLILLMYLAWVLLRLSHAGLDPSSLVTSTAVITAVLAFAMQDTLGNILSGLALQLDHSVRLGDWIELEDVTGEVIQVQWRHTAVRTRLGELVLIPNSQLMKSRVMLIGGPMVPKRQRAVFFYAGYELPASEVVVAVETALRKIRLPMIATDPPPFCLVGDFSEGMVRYEARYWLTDTSRPGIGDSHIRQHLHAIFQRQGWSLAAPALRWQREPRPDGAAAVHGERGGLDERELARRSLALAQQSLFSLLTPQERERLALHLRRVYYAAGSVIIRQGEVGDYLFLLVRGEVEVWVAAQAGHEQLVAVVSPGQVMGEMSLMTGEPRRATLVARTSIECYRLDRPAFEAILAQRPALADALAQLLSTRSEALADSLSAPERAPAVAKADILERMRQFFGLAR